MTTLKFLLEGLDMFFFSFHLKYLKSLYYCLGALIFRGGFDRKKITKPSQIIFQITYIHFQKMRDILGANKNTS